MPNVQWADFGVAGLFAAFVIVAVYKLPDIIKSFKNSDSSKFMQAIENNTLAVQKLTNFLEKQDAVKAEQDKQYAKEIAGIKGNTEKIMETLSKHTVQCEGNCINRARGLI